MTLPHSSNESELNMIEQSESDYIVYTDWITFYYSKTDYDESDILDITTEAERVMQDIRTYLNLNYNVEEADGTVCFFDSSFRNEKGEKRSMCYWSEKRIQCVSLDSFVHEYVHLVSERNKNNVYRPNEIFVEGLATYVSSSFFDVISSNEYKYFKPSTVSRVSDLNEHNTISELLSSNGMEYNSKNYNKALVAMADKKYGVSRVDKNSDFYKYYMGAILVDYCVNRLGGIDVFMTAYVDSLKVSEVYGKSVEELVVDACNYNTSVFYGDE